VSRALRKWLAELVFIVTFIALAGWLANDFIGNAAIADRRARNACPGNLNRLADALTRYRAEHSGKMPPDAATFRPYLDSRAFVYHPAYACRFGSRGRLVPAPICWDAVPHNTSRRAVRWKNRPYRNVLYADGRVTIVAEAEFRRMSLEGETLASRLPNE